MPKKDDGTIGPDESVKSIKERIELIKKTQRMIQESSKQTEERVYKVSSSVSGIILDFDKKMKQLQQNRDKLTKMAITLAKKDDLSLEFLGQINEETSNIESQIKSLFSLPPMNEIKPFSAEKSVEPSIQPTPKNGFRSKEHMVKIGLSVLEKYSFFTELVDEEQRRAYENLLILRSLKISIIETIYGGAYGIPSIAKELSSNENNVQKGLNTLVDFGEVSVGYRNLSDKSKYMISFFRSIKEKAKENPLYAALAILPFIITDDRGKGISEIEQFTKMDKQTIIQGAQVLYREGYVWEDTKNNETIYFGDTTKSLQLLKSIKGTYRGTRV
jgi:hypothetical protein